jgi:hypothetical protein
VQAGAGAGSAGVADKSDIYGAWARRIQLDEGFAPGTQSLPLNRIGSDWVGWGRVAGSWGWVASGRAGLGRRGRGRGSFAAVMSVGRASIAAGAVDGLGKFGTAAGQPVN